MTHKAVLTIIIDCLGGENDEVWTRSNAFLVYVVKPTMTGGKGSWLLTRDAKNSPFTLII